MQYILKLTLLLAFTALIASCGDGKKEKNGALNDKKVALEKLKAEQKKVNDQVAKLEEEIAKLDPNAAASLAKLVTVEVLDGNNFNHFIDLQGKIDARNTSYVAPRNGQGGIVRAIYVKQGDYVKKGQTLLKLDDAVAGQQLTAAQQQVEQVRAQLNLAQTTYQRYKNLWANNIGTEMQVIQAKAQVETLTSQLRAAEAQAGIARQQVSYTTVTADNAGTIDELNIRVGEMFTGASTSDPQISIVNTSVLKLHVNVPEAYVDRIKVGSPLVITLPDANNKTIHATASVVSKLIDPSSRSFYVEANVPADPSIRANQIAKVQIQDYSRSDAITIPVNILQTDQNGKYVLVATKEGGKLVARKKAVVVGELYGDRLEIKSGLTAGEQIITDGFQNLYDGQAITTK
ncbi:MAG: efflux RND transporter periplasmic adaptor subunit [Niabella sp.]